jgi:hypothetical protein
MTTIFVHYSVLSFSFPHYVFFYSTYRIGKIPSLKPWLVCEKYCNVIKVWTNQHISILALIFALEYLQHRHLLSSWSPCSSPFYLMFWSSFFWFSSNQSIFIKFIYNTKLIVVATKVPQTQFPPKTYIQILRITRLVHASILFSPKI